MADISKLLWWRFFRGEPTAHVLHYERGRLKRSGRGLGFWFLPLGTTIAEIPLRLVVVAGSLPTARSEMNAGGVVFGDGIESDAIAFDWGTEVSIGPAATALHLLTG